MRCPNLFIVVWCWDSLGTPCIPAQPDKAVFTVLMENSELMSVSMDKAFRWSLCENFSTNTLQDKMSETLSNLSRLFKIEIIFLQLLMFMKYSYILYLCHHKQICRVIFYITKQEPSHIMTYLLMNLLAFLLMQFTYGMHYS